MFGILLSLLSAPTIIFSVLFSVFILVIRKQRKPSRKVPPGPKGLPLIGSTVFLKPWAYKILDDFTKQYGPIYEFKFCGQPIVVLGNYEIIKEALVKKGDVFSGRPKSFLFEWYSGNGGIVFSEGDLWKEHRRFALTTLRDFGFGKVSLEDRILNEAQFVINEFNEQNGQPFDAQIILCKTVSNVILSLACNKRMDYDNKSYENLLSKIDGIIDAFKMTNPVNFFPPIRFLLKSWNKFADNVADIRRFLLDIIEEHEQSYDADNQRDYVDCFLGKLKDDKKNQVKDSTFTHLQLARSIDNFFLAGTETTSTTLRWAILYLMHNEDIQKRVQVEIDSVLGSARPPSMSDRPNLPFTDATIMEVQRYANLVPLSVAHTADEDVNLCGYDIPKGAYVIQNLTAVHFDPKYWSNPHKFDPTRFLDVDGNVKKNIESFIPFSIGKRVCLGESLAKMELFLFFVTFLQRFSFKSPPGVQLPSMTDCLEGGALRPLPYKLCAIAR